MNRNQRRAAAKTAGKQSSLPVSTPAALCELGFDLLNSGQVAEADRCCRQALTQQPDFADALHLMGIIAVSRKQYGHAVEWIAGALRQTPKPEYLHSLGNALQLLGRLDEALKAYDKGVTLRPDDAELWHLMELVLTRLSRIDEAVQVFQHVLKLSPLHKEAATIRGRLLYEAACYDEAVPCYDVCAELEPDRAAVFEDRGVCHARMSRFELALADYERALKLDPDHADTHNNLGLLHLRCGRYDAASQCFERAAALDPDRVDFLISKGVGATEKRKFAEAFKSYNRALAIHPDANTQWNLSLLNMLTGNFAAGWAGRELRWQANIGMVQRNFAEPLWLGQEPIAGKTILLHADEGIGDAIQFSRYVPMVAALGARVILEVHQPVHPLLSRLPGVSHSQPHDCPMPEFDLHCPLSSLPLAFQTRLDSIPAPIPYLPAPPEALQQQWESRLGPHDRLRVGLVWSGGLTHTNDHNRSTTLRALSPILSLEATFVSVQKDPRDHDRIALSERANLIDASEHLTDFVATAALLSCLDLVITVDTSVAHLAGALGRPVWILLPYTPDYRWLLDREDSPWYPTARLFRQDATRDYGQVVERIKSELQSLIVTRRSKSEQRLSH